MRSNSQEVRLKAEDCFCASSVPLEYQRSKREQAIEQIVATLYAEAVQACLI